MGIKLITFDFTGTLAYIRRPISNIYIKHANRIFLKGTKPLFDERIVQRNFELSYRNLTKELPCFGQWKGLKAEEWWSVVVERTFRLSGLNDMRFIKRIARELYHEFSTGRQYRLYPDTMKAVNFLRARNVTLGIISNFDMRLPNILLDLGLEGIEYIQCSELAGVEKPDTDIFINTLASTDTDPFDAVHIGNDLKKDYFGALDAGMRGIWLCRGNPRTLHNVKKKGIESVSSLDQAVRILAHELE